MLDTLMPPELARWIVAIFSPIGGLTIGCLATNLVNRAMGRPFMVLRLSEPKPVRNKA